MIKAKWITIASALVLTVACQQGSLDVSLTEYQSKSNEALTKLTDSYSAALSRGIGSSRGLSYVQGYQDPSFQNPFSSQMFGGGMSIPPLGINQSIDAVADQCVAMIQSMPTTQASYAPVMATLARCLNRIVSEQSLLFTWLYQLQSVGAQTRWAYALDYPNANPFSSFSGDTFNQVNPAITNGFIQVLQ